MPHLESISQVRISKSALLHNIQVFRDLCPDSRFAAVVKSNAYGHDLKLCVHHLKNHVDGFAVNTIQELCEIRDHDQTSPVLVMGLNGMDFDALNPQAKKSSDLVISSLSQLRLLLHDHPDQRFHLKIDTGLSRLGMNLKEFEECTGLLKTGGLQQWTGLMTHFANVEDVSDQSYAHLQLQIFLKAIGLAKKIKPDLVCHTAASAAAMILPESRMDLIRIGISLYGLWPSSQTRLSLLSQCKILPELKPALSWQARIVHVHDVAAGASLGYGCTSRVEQSSRVAVVPIGYFEGYDRLLSNQAYVLIGGRRAPLLGRVSMNMIIVDITLIPDTKPGDTVLLLGEMIHPESGQVESITADQLAEWTGSINYEIVTRILPDIPRIMVD